MPLKEAAADSQATLAGVRQRSRSDGLLNSLFVRRQGRWVLARPLWIDSENR
jgi:hypothetical protein